MRMLTIFLLLMLTPLPSFAEGETAEEAALFPVCVKGKWGYIDREGQVVIEPRFRRARDFSCGVALVQKFDADYLARTYGYIQPDGSWAIDEWFDFAEPFQKGVAVISINQGLNSRTEALIDLEGRRIIVGGKLAGRIGDGRLVNGTRFMRQGPCEVYDLEGNLMKTYSYDGLSPYSEGLAAFYTGDKAGYIDMEGEEAIPATFESVRHAGSFNEGLAILTFWPEENARRHTYSVIDRQGKVVFSGTGRGIGNCSDGLFLDTVETRENGIIVSTMFGYRDRQGDWAIEPGFDAAASFSEGLALTRTGDNWEIIDKTGKVSASIEHRDDFQYCVPGSFNNGLAAISSWKPCAEIDADGNVLRQLPMSTPIWNPQLKDFFDGREMFLERNGLYGYRDTDGNVVIEPIYDEALDFNQGLAAVRQNGGWSYLSPKGITVIPGPFQDAGPFSEGLAPVVKNDRWGYINRLGVFVIKPRYVLAGRFQNGLAIVGETIDPDLEPRSYVPSSGMGFAEELYWVEWDGNLTKSYIDKQGNTVLTDDDFWINNPFSEGRALALHKGPWSFEPPCDYIDLNGEFITDYHLNNGSEYKDGRARVIFHDYTAYIDTEGNVIWPQTE